MTDDSKRLIQLLKVIEGKEHDFKNKERMIYQNIKVLHLGMQSKLYKIMLTWDFGLHALNKNQYKDIKESLEDDYNFYKQALISWRNQNMIPEIPQSQELIDIYIEWLIEMLHHDIVGAFRNLESNPDMETLRRLITDYRDKLQRIYIDVED